VLHQAEVHVTVDDPRQLGHPISVRTE
jgi:hypothetical protein